MDNKERLSFEDALTELELIVQQLENQDVTLDDSLKLYEKGIKLSKLCNDVLHDAELRIQHVNEEQDVR